MTETEPIHVLDQIEAYLSDGLSPDERLAIESHAAICPACADALMTARQTDEQLRDLFAEVQPTIEFEDRIIKRIRGSRPPRRRLIHPMVRRAAVGIAAAVLLAGTGIVVTQTLNGGRPWEGWSPFGSSRGIGMGSSVREMAVAMSPPVARTTAQQHGANTELSLLDDSPAVRLSGANTYSGGTTLAGLGSDLSIKPGGNEILSTAAVNAGEARGAGSVDVPTLLPGTIQASGGAVFGSRGGGSFFKPSDHLQKAGASTINGGTLDQFDTIKLPQDSGGPAARNLTPTNKSRNELAANVAQQAAADQDNAAAAAISASANASPRQAGSVPAAPNANPAKGQQAPADGDSPAASGRMVIRNGTMEFEVDRFDDALVRITKLVQEQQGFVATTDSDKLPNGRMKGAITLRVPPQRLDTLVLTLRGVGDLKSQKITAEDVTRHYTDLDSELRADRAMEDRLLGIIKTGTGQIKDLLAAEKELAVWREKIEQIEGEKRYLDNQVAFSTLVLSLYEKDIRTPAMSSESADVNLSLETENVADAYDKVLEAIKTAKGRIRQSELKQFDAGQYGATIVAAIPPDAAEQVIARVRQLEGRIVHFARQQKQTTQDGALVPADVTQVRREDTILSMQIYNLANIAPRRTTTMKIAVPQVDRVFQQVLDQVRSAGGRIVTSSLNKPDPNTQVGELDVQTPAEKAQTLLDALHGYGEVMQQESTENPDTADVTDAKRRFRLTLVSLAAVSPRQTQTIQLAAADVPRSFNDILNAVRGADGRVLQSDLSEQDVQNVNGTLSFEMPMAALATVTAAMDKAAEVLTRTVTRLADTQNTVDSKIRLTLSLVSADRLAPRQTTTIGQEVPDVDRASDDLVAAAVSAGGRRVGSGGMNQDHAGHETAQVVVDVPLAKAQSILDQVERMGYRRTKQVSFDNTVPEGSLARARIDVTFSNSAASLGGEETTGDAIRNGLSVSGLGLRWSAQMLVVGLCFVAPWAIVLWIIWRLVRRARRRKIPTPPASVPAA